MVPPGPLCPLQGRGRAHQAQAGGGQPAAGRRLQILGAELRGPLHHLADVVGGQALAEHQGLALGDLGAGLAPHGVLPLEFGQGQQA